MKGTAIHGDDILDTVEYARPSEVSWERVLQDVKSNNYCTNTFFFVQGGDVISTLLRREYTYDQKQGTCAEVRGQLSKIKKFALSFDFASFCFQHFEVANANCTTDSDCVQGEADLEGNGIIMTSRISFPLFYFY